MLRRVLRPERWPESDEGGLGYPLGYVGCGSLLLRSLVEMSQFLFWRVKAKINRQRRLS